MSGSHDPGRGEPRGRKVRVEFRHNRKARQRRKSLPPHLAEAADERDELAQPERERLAKDELSRKRTVIETDDPAARGVLDGTVLAVRGLVADVHAADGQRYACTIRRILRTRRIEERHPVVVGDRVRITPVPVAGDAPPEGVIESVYPRRTQLSRADHRRLHIIAANVDQVVIVASADLPPLKTSLIDRYLVSASAGMMAAVICINKVDLDTGFVEEVLERYRRIGYPALATSVVTGQGIDALREVLRNRSSVLAGQSGVGKSSLLNAIQPGLRLRTGEVARETGKGRHTTTTAQLLALEMGGYVVDTPGIRAFELGMIPTNELEAHFVEFIPYIPRCRFPNCTHVHEIGCAVKEAVERGDIHPDRHATYVRLFRERCGLVPAEDYEEIVQRR